MVCSEVACTAMTYSNLSSTGSLLTSASRFLLRHRNDQLNVKDMRLQFESCAIAFSFLTKRLLFFMIVVLLKEVSGGQECP